MRYYSSGFHNPLRRFHLALLFAISISFPSSTYAYISSECNNGTTYNNNGSSFSNNLNRVMDALLQNTPHRGFKTSLYGQIPERAYGLLHCIGNISSQDCSSCSREAKYSLQEHCGNASGGQIWMGKCFLRYDSSDFISKLDTSGIQMYNTQNMTEKDLIASRSIALDLLSNLFDKAYDEGFASGLRNYSSTADEVSWHVFGLVQCWRDTSLEDCRSCLIKAMPAVKKGCSTKSGAQVLYGSCTVKYLIYPSFDFRGSHVSRILAERPAAAESPEVSHTNSKKSSKKLHIALAIVSAMIGGGLLAFTICRIKTRILAARARRKQALAAQNEESLESGLIKKEQTIFTLEALKEATKGFHDDNKLGEGGFGRVYKGTTKSGKEIAVKKLSKASSQGKTEFMNEVNLVANIQHRNLVNLLGCCADGDERLLVYEYLPNKSLDTFLFDPEKRKQLDWQTRYNIIMGIARGLLYLHEDSQLRIIHRDIKANNILLDRKLNPKIADFGLARLFPEDETYIQSRVVAGTPGYVAPEYLIQGKLSVKADVYSFGVLLLEIVSGRKNNSTDLPLESHSLSEWAWKLHEAEDILKMVDNILGARFPEEQVIRCIHVGLLCIQADAIIRPSTSEVIMMISSNSMPLPSPADPAFASVRYNSLLPSPPSVDEASITQVEPR